MDQSILRLKSVLTVKYVKSWGKNEIEKKKCYQNRFENETTRRKKATHNLIGAEADWFLFIEEKSIHGWCASHLIFVAVNIFTYKYFLCAFVLFSLCCCCLKKNKFLWKQMVKEKRRQKRTKKEYCFFFHLYYNVQRENVHSAYRANIIINLSRVLSSRNFCLQCKFEWCRIWEQKQKTISFAAQRDWRSCTRRFFRVYRDTIVCFDVFFRFCWCPLLDGFALFRQSSETSERAVFFDSFLYLFVVHEKTVFQLKWQQEKYLLRKEKKQQLLIFP